VEKRGLRILNLGLVDYHTAFVLQNKIIEKVKKGGENTLILCEHPHVFTIGRHSDEKNLLSHDVPLVRTDRGGDITYHGPGQLVGYPIVNIRKKGMGVKEYMSFLEETLIVLLETNGINAGRFDSFRGVWVERRKIASIGIKVEEGAVKHGVALNVNTDLSYFEKIIPCGLGYPTTSMEEELGRRQNFSRVREDYTDIFSLSWNSL
jgi:lipoyl(octanoyl) transferase